MAARHPNIVNIREVVMGDTLSQSHLSYDKLKTEYLLLWTLLNMI